MEPALSVLTVQMTGRFSALLFAAALLIPTVSAQGARRAAELFVAFVAAQTAHFAAVLWFAIVNDGQDIFPSSRSMQEAGGWPTVLGICAFFYALAFVALAARQAGSAAGGRLRRADGIATTIIGLMFLITYVPLITTSLWFAVPAALVLAGLIAYAFGDSVRRLPCRAP